MSGRLQFACQTYSWQMSIERYRGRVDHMASVAAAAGFAGLEPEVIMLGDDWTADGLERSLKKAKIALAILVLAEPWRTPVETAAEHADATRAIEAAARLGSKLLLVQLPGPDRKYLRERQEALVSCMAAVADRAGDAGVGSTFHPNSPAGSVFRTADDYRLLRDLLPETIGFTPDLGHIAKGGMDPLAVVIEWREQVDHVHVKDLGPDGTWSPTGEGIVDIPAVLRYLESTGYDGWVTFEDESAQAQADPDGAAARNGAWVRRWREER